MSQPASGAGAVNGGKVQYYKRDFWSQENLKYANSHYRLRKCAHIVNRVARGRQCTVLDVGCGPAALRHLLNPNIEYHGVDIAIPEPAPNLREGDFLESPVAFGDKTFDIVVAQGFFEYAGGFQSQKFEEIARILRPGGKFIVSYVNFGHRDREIYWPYNNVQDLKDFRNGLLVDFNVHRSFPTSHNWRHNEPNWKLVSAANMHLNMNIPVISPMLAVEYFFICSARTRGDVPPEERDSSHQGVPDHTASA
jgi:SAM-dependent methyltransferase